MIAKNVWEKEEFCLWDWKFPLNFQRRDADEHQWIDDEPGNGVSRLTAPKLTVTLPSNEELAAESSPRKYRRIESPNKAEQVRWDASCWQSIFPSMKHWMYLNKKIWIWILVDSSWYFRQARHRQEHRGNQNGSKSGTFSCKDLVQRRLVRWGRRASPTTWVGLPILKIKCDTNWAFSNLPRSVAKDA